MEHDLDLKSMQMRSIETMRNQNNNEIILSIQSMNRGTDYLVTDKAVGIVCLKIQRMEFFI